MAISVDSLDTSATLAHRLGLTFPLLSDADVALTRAYRIEDEAKDIALPATYVVDRSGTVVYALVGEAPRDLPLLDEVLAAIPTN